MEREKERRAYAKRAALEPIALVLIFIQTREVQYTPESRNNTRRLFLPHAASPVLSPGPRRVQRSPGGAVAGGRDWRVKFLRF